MKVAIIGAGIAGLSAAEALLGAGHTVRLFDKGRGPGGRMSTRRAQTAFGEIRFDHGAQYFTVRDPHFRAAVSQWIKQGVVSAWDGQFVRIERNGQIRPVAPEAYYVGTPSMNAVVKHMAVACDVTWGTRITELERKAASWRLSAEDGLLKDTYDGVIIAVPAEQAAPLLKVHKHLACDFAEQVISAPCWAVMAAFEETPAIDFDAARLDEGPLSWIARNVSKPGRGEIETWVLHASPAWSKTHLEADPEQVAKHLLSAFKEIAGPSVPYHMSAHRWRYAMVDTKTSLDRLWQPELGLGVCGDWTHGARVEAAWRSGKVVAREIISEKN